MNLLEKNKLEEVLKHLAQESLHPKAIAHLHSHEGPWAIACSGGADSVCLLFTIKALFPKHSLHIFHFNHQTRPKENEREAAYVESLAAELNLPLHILTPDTVPENTSEAHLRKLRLQAFHKQLNSLNIKILLQGHHLDDVAESLLMKLSRGSGTQGLSSPHPVQTFKNNISHVRPLISITKEKIVSTLEALDINWCEDSSNDQDYYFRNRVRKYLLPEWRSISPTHFYKGVSLAREQLEEDNEAIEHYLYQTISKPKKNLAQNLTALKNTPKALLRRAIKDWLHAQGIVGSLKFCNIIFEQIFSNNLNKRVNLGEQTILFENNTLALLETPVIHIIDYQVLTVDSEILLPEGKSLLAEIINPSEKLFKEITTGKIDNASTAYLDINLTAPLEVRSWEAGDQYKPLNAPGNQKLQDLFTNAKIPQQLRKSLPVILHLNEILWVPNFPINHHFKVKNNYNLLLKLTYK